MKTDKTAELDKKIWNACQEQKPFSSNPEDNIAPIRDIINELLSAKDTDQEKIKKYDELILLLKKLFPGNGNVTFDGEVIDKIARIVNPLDDWRYKNSEP